MSLNVEPPETAKEPTRSAPAARGAEDLVVRSPVAGLQRRLVEQRVHLSRVADERGTDTREPFVVPDG
jgi:hypothetical protein